MSDVAIGFTGLGCLLLLLAIRTPIAIALISVSLVGLYALLGWRVAWGALGTIPYQFAANWVLSSVPMFLLLGFICYHTELTKGLFAAARVWFGRSTPTSATTVAARPATCSVTSSSSAHRPGSPALGARALMCRRSGSSSTLAHDRSRSTP